MVVTGSFFVNGLTNPSKTNVITYDTSTGQLFYTSSNSLISAGGFLTTSSFNNVTGSFLTTSSFNNSTGSFLTTSSFNNATSSFLTG